MLEVGEARPPHIRGAEEVANHGKHADAAVLDFGEAQAVELSLVGVLKERKRVPVAKRDLGTNFVLVLVLNHGAGRRHAGRWRHEGRGRGEGEG